MLHHKQLSINSTEHNRSHIVDALKKEILGLQGLRQAKGDERINTGLGDIEKAFPTGCFPLGTIHEFISNIPENATATNAFIAGLLSKLMSNNKVCVWIGAKRALYPPALRMFGVYPERIIFIDLPKDKDVLWVVEEALKCNSLAVVVAELKELSFTESRRLQLAVESSSVTGFVHRFKPRTENTVACVSRWKISTLPSKKDGMPGVGHTRWHVNLTKVRNGTPGEWQLEWKDNSFKPVLPDMLSIPETTLKAS